MAAGVRGGVGGDPLEERVTEARDEALLVRCAHHGVRLARPRLTVGEDASVVAGEGIVEDVMPDGREHRLLRGERRALAGQGVEAVVEGEGFGLLATVWLVEGRGVAENGLHPAHGNDAFAAQLLLSPVEGPHPHRHPYLIHGEERPRENI